MNKKISKLTIAVDFDGVIHRYSEGWKDGSIYDVPLEGAKEALEKLGSKFQIVIYTTRLNPNLNDVTDQERKMRNWFEKFGFKEGVHYHKLTSYKPKAKIYLDDRALKFSNWLQALQTIGNL